MSKTKLLRISGIVLLLICLIGGIILFRPKPVRVAAVNMPDFMMARMAVSVDKKNISLIPENDLKKLKKYDAVIAFGMGLKWTDEDRDLVMSLDDKKIPYMVMMSPNPQNSLCNIDSLQQETLIKYLSNGGTSNYRSGFNYLRRDILKKSLREGTVAEPKTYGSDLLFTRDDEDRSFNSVEEYQKYYNEHGYRADAPRVALLTGIAGPFNGNRHYLDEMIAGLEAEGMNVYPIAAGSKRITFMEEIKPNLVIYLAHGRLAAGKSEQAINWLKEHNVPLLTPLIVGTEQEKWMKDPKGMMGGYLSQSIVTPELDGAIEPFVLVTLQTQPDGIKLFKTVPERLKTFTTLCKNHIKLQSKPNSEKRVAIYYFKGPGQNGMVAQGLEVVPSLYNTLKHLQKEGYNVAGLPDNAAAFGKMIMEQGSIFNSYAEGSTSRYLNSGYPAFVSADTLQAWLQASIMPQMIDTLNAHYGPVPGEYMTLEKDGQKGIAVTRIQLGNIALLPQPAQGAGENNFKMVHGSTPVPAYPFLASYLWTRNAFKADVMMHFGTHGSFEFIQGKQVALSSLDWGDRLRMDMPHVYYYTTANVGESMMAKRRSYAELVSYLAVPFMDTELEGQVKNFLQLTDDYLSKEEDDEKLSLQIKKLAVKEGYYRDLKLDSNLNVPFSRRDIESLADFVQELASAKIPGGMYTTSVPFPEQKIRKSVQLLSVDPVAYALAMLDKHRGLITDEELKKESLYATRYYLPAKKMVIRYEQHTPADLDKELLACGVKPEELEQVKAWDAAEKEKEEKRRQMMLMMMGGGSSQPQASAQMKAHSEVKKKKPSMAEMMKMAAQGKKMPSKEEIAKMKAAAKKGNPMSEMMKPKALTPEELKQKELSEAIGTLREAIAKVNYYKRALHESPQLEMKAMTNAFAGGYTAPSPGGDYIASPSVLPTGRNLFAIDAETTPTERAWKHGTELGKGLLEDYMARHNGEYPQKVSFTLWSSSFIESEGATIAEILYMLGVEPVRDRMGRVLDVRLIPIQDLGRPRIDVVVQTSGQLRDLAASRLFLIQKAVDLAAQADDADPNVNRVAKGVKDAERVLLDKGIPPAEARALSSARVFGGLNGAYGTGIQSMVEAGDRWEKTSEIADVYAHNMGAIYGTDQDWGGYTKGAFEAALQNTDAVVQPRQSNTWGALSLDHVYEFMGGLTLTVRELTGKDPEGYFNDLRNRNRVRTQEIKQAIGVEARTTLLNPAYVREQLKEGAGAAGAIDETIRNTYAWNVMKPSAIDNELWDGLFDMYVADTQNLGIKEFFDKNNPAAMQDYTAAMMETIRKGLWKATPEQIKAIAELHAESLKEHGAGCSQMVCDNMKLQNFIGRQLPEDVSKDYLKKIDQARNIQAEDKPKDSDQKQQVLKKEEQNKKQAQSAAPVAKSSKRNGIFIALGIIFVILVAILLKRQRDRKKSN